MSNKLKRAMGNQYRILIVDGDKSFFEKIGKIFLENGFLVFWVNSGSQAIEQAKLLLPHLILLEVEIPEIDGIELCSAIRETPELSNSIVVILTNQSEEYIQVLAYKAGCDDFIVKTIKNRILIYRLLALLKRQFAINKPSAANIVRKTENRLYIDPERFIVVVGDKDIYLPKKQFLLLQLLASRPSKVYSRDSIFEFLWGQNSSVGHRTIDVYIRKIREQIGIRYIKTVKGVGYRFN